MLKSVYASLAVTLVCALLSFNVLAQSEPIGLGFLTVRTGALAAGGKQMEDGIVLFLKERNYTLAGRKIDHGAHPFEIFAENTLELINLRCNLVALRRPSAANVIRRCVQRPRPVYMSLADFGGQRRDMRTQPFL